MLYSVELTDHGGVFRNRTGSSRICSPATYHPPHTPYAALCIISLSLSAAYEAANASGLTIGITLHVPLM